jgi:hypothetical protein
MTPVDPEVPPAGEEIHLPEPSILPMLLAVAITLTLVGVTITPIFIVAGVGLGIPVVYRWIRSARAEFRHLPPG